MVKRLIETIPCTDEEGSRYTVQVFQDFRTFRPLKGQPQEYPGTKSAQLSDGSPVNFRDEGKFQLVLSGTLLHRADR